MAASMIDTVDSPASALPDEVIPTIEMPTETPDRWRRRLSWSQTPGMPLAPDQDSPEPGTLFNSTPAAPATNIRMRKTSPRKKRIVLNAADHLVLMRLCGEHRQDYRQGNIMRFWDLITDLFETDTSKLYTTTTTTYY
jgi:hypothetical protein